MLRARTTHRTTMNQAKGHFALQGKAMWIAAFAYSFGYNFGQLTLLLHIFWAKTELLDSLEDL